MSRRSAGQGTIYKNANGTFTAQITTPTARPSKTLKSERAARLWLTKMTRELDTGEYVAPSDMTLGQWWDRWVEVYKSKTVSPVTLASYRYSRARLPDKLLARRIGEITPSDIQSALNRIVGGRRTIEITRTALQMCFARAVTDGMIRTNPVSTTQLPRERPAQKAKALTDADDAKLLQMLTAPCRQVKGRQHERDMATQTIRDALYLVRMTGVRRGEAVGVKWDDIGEQIHIRGTKNSYSDRMLPIIPEVKAMLDRRRFTRQSEYVFATSTGRPVDGSNLLRWMDEHTVYTVHDLRHTYITRAAQAGVNPKVLQTLTGHARLETLLGVYTHVTDADRARAALAIVSKREANAE